MKERSSLKYITIVYQCERQVRFVSPNGHDWTDNKRSGVRWDGCNVEKDQREDHGSKMAQDLGFSCLFFNWDILRQAARSDRRTKTRPERLQAMGNITFCTHRDGKSEASKQMFLQLIARYKKLPTMHQIPHATNIYSPLIFIFWTNGEGAFGYVDSKILVSPS